MKTTNIIITNIRKLLTMSLLCTAIIIMSGCRSSSYPGETTGTIGGGPLGNQFGSDYSSPDGQPTPDAAVSAVTQSNMDKVDSLNLDNSLQNQSDNKSTTWVNPNSNVRYTVTPTGTVNDGKNYCRDYTVNKIIDGQSQTVTERACRENGRWIKQ